MKYKLLQTTTGEKIHIYDDVYASHKASKLLEFLELTLYRIGSRSVTTLQSNNENYLQCVFSEDDLLKFGILEYEETKQILEKHGLKKPDRYWTLLSTYLSQYQFHIDSKEKGDKTFLYYANIQWHKDWGGETLFCNDKGELEIAVEFKPNRVVIFDNHIEHKPATLAVQSYPYRHIFVAQFKGEKI